jgi:hypothetical protein
MVKITASKHELRQLGERGSEDGDWLALQRTFSCTARGARWNHTQPAIFDQIVMLADEFPGMSTSPHTLNGTTTITPSVMN